MSVNELADEAILGVEEVEERPSDLAVMLTGGGARAAYQVGLLLGIARHFPNLKFQVITGVSAGAINASFLAANEGTLLEKTERLADVWCALECDHIFRFDLRSLLPFRSALASLFPKRHWGTMADSETFAHLEHLAHAGGAERYEERGMLVYRMELAPGPA